MIEMNRRRLLQYFGIGAMITPVVSGAPVMETTATLLEIPRVELVDTFPNGHAPSLFASRLKWNPYEAIWLYMWQVENNPGAGINSGIGALEHILGRVPTDAEKAACAGIMQWFGTNCGHGFIEEALLMSGYRITYESTPQADVIRQLQHANVWSNQRPADPVRVKYRGRQITLGYGEPGGVLR